MTNYVIDYFELPSSDVDASQRFFAAAFGFGRTDYGPGYSEITGAGVLGGLNGIEGDKPTAPLIGIRTTDIEGAASAVRAAGGALVGEIVDYPGGRRFTFREPGGSELLVYCPSE